MKFVKKILPIILSLTLIVIFEITCNATVSYAGLGDIITEGDDFTKAGAEKSFFNEVNQRNAVNDIYFILLGVGIIVAIASGLIIGIKFITSGVEGQAKIKEKILPFIIGCIVIFGGLGIWRLVLYLTSDTFKEDTAQQTIQAISGETMDL